VIILSASIKEWLSVINGRKAAVSSETPFVRTQLTGA
jgi:hypothetical protein